MTGQGGEEEEDFVTCGKILRFQLQDADLRLCWGCGGSHVTRAQPAQTTEPKTVTVWPFKDKLANPHFYTVQALRLFTADVSWTSSHVVH